ncbi:LuxR C-terminal-related transcriptional regulator [Rhizobacter sp. SG703]|uniref:LuxR C-terminal-related transcriptional regulator n=1 Tax=Rhizobacter sp. SG703 TaxID=2587140 RepID=UPI00144598F5|nr:LuxR C-terminal-related transcriptional regulator [Rhizobacter sp. SG703]NKI96771.1 LuxR family maltose regulon positive regulatory protein [Rhizobacter sp. SG703]
MSEAPPFALTKIQPPRPRGEHLARPQLERQLAAAIGQARLMLLSAPAGFGKTALMGQLLASCSGTAVAWIAADDDDDLARFVACLAAALEPLDLPWRISPQALSMLGPQPRGLRRIADELLSALGGADLPQGQGQGLIVLDDAHRIADARIFELLDLLLEHLPAPWTVLLASRTDPPLSLARLRAQGELLELRQAELGFADDEVRALAAQRGAGASLVQSLIERLQGWPAGIRLSLDAATLAGNRTPAALGQRHLFDYLASEVLADMPDGLRRFLLQTSVLAELQAGRCAALTGDPQAAGWLDDIERRGLFVTVLDGPQLTLRLHDLFRDFLEDRLRQESPEALTGLLHRSADTEPDDARRIAYLQRVGDWAAAEAALDAVARGWLTDGRLTQAQRLLAQFPPAWREGSAPLMLLQGLAAWTRWEFPAMAGHFQQALRLAEQQGLADQAQLARAYVALSLCQLDKRDEAAALLAELRTQALPREAEVTTLTASLWHAGDYGPVGPSAGYMARRNELLADCTDIGLWYQATPNPRDVALPGIAPALTLFVERALRLAPEQPTAMSAIAWLLHGLTALWQGDAARAAERLERATEEARWLGSPRNVGTMLALARGLLHALRGDVDATRRAAAHLVADADQEPPSARREKLRRHAQFQALRLAMIADDGERARALVAALGAPDLLVSNRIAQRARELALPALSAELAEDWPQAVAGWQAALQTPDALEWYGLLTEGRLRLAAALVRLGRPRDAAPFVEAAVARCATDGWIGSALLAGPRVLAVLAHGGLVLSAGAQVALANWLDGAERLRGHRPPSADNASAIASREPAAVPQADPLASLSAREREVLARMAAGDSNKVIARAFELSPHTVKRHVANILDKLGADTRGQAAARWRDVQSTPGEAQASRVN